MIKWLALATLIAASLVQVPSPVVRTTSGLLRGTLGHNGKFYQYFGVPYGTVDDTNRFQAPLPPPTWEGIFHAVDENVWCPQRAHFLNTIIGHPNCLKLNIYTPTTAKPNDPLPVMVFVHGGCFFEGSGSRFFYGGENFPEHGVVFVGINYRLNVEGFLCLGIKQAPGNAGLRDQVAALKWIKENIRSFGGDPDNVVLFGESAGAVSISYLMLTSIARGLFHKVILQSGSSLVPWGMQHNPIENARTLVKAFGYDIKDPYEIYDILSKKSFDELIRAIKYSRTKNWITADTLFVPCIENEIEGVEPIITEYPLDIIKSGNYTKVPMIIGYNDKEGIFFVAKDFGTSVHKVNVPDLFKNDLVFADDAEKNRTAEKVHGHYFSGKDELIMDMVNLYSDLHFKYPSAAESEMFGRTTDQLIYYYMFKYSGTLNVVKFISSFIGVKGASHADELFYMVKPHVFPTPQRRMEAIMINRMLTMWTNFAKFSDPTPKTTNLLPVKWHPSRDPNPRALIIDSHLTTGPLWDEPSIRLWNDTYKKYRRKGYGFKNNAEFRLNCKSKRCDQLLFKCNDTSKINLGRF